MEGMKIKNILISGASVAGPVAAYWLCKFGFNVTIIEKYPSLRLGGYRIDIRGKATEIVEKMNLRPALQNSSVQMKGSAIMKANGTKIIELNPLLFGLRRNCDIEIMKGDLTEILYNLTKNKAEYIFDNSITSVSLEADGVTVKLQMGEERKFDLLIIADGVRSSLRSMVFNEKGTTITKLDYFISVFSIPNFLSLNNQELAYSSVGKVINVFSTGDLNEAKAMIIFKADTSVYLDQSQQKELLKGTFLDEGGEIAKLSNYVDGTGDFYFSSLDQILMDNLYKDRVVLVGDAGYCPSPASGQGTSMAIVGAYVLAGELLNSIGEYQRAFKSYQDLMQGFIIKNQDLAHMVLEQMLPKSKSQLWFQSIFLKVISHFAVKEKILSKMLDKMMRDVDGASNSIDLKEYGTRL
jgi:2-polyprenyl-6-methoxyphenol hydroxylase-like FAD-dependent oxidoreductase